MTFGSAAAPGGPPNVSSPGERDGTLGRYAAALTVAGYAALQFLGRRAGQEHTGA